VDPGVLAAAHTAAGGVVYWQNDLDQGEAHYQAALELDRRHGRADRIGDDHYNLAFVAMLRRDLDAARERLAESGKAFATEGQAERLADSKAALGALEMRAGNLTLARELIEEGRRLHIEHGNLARATDNTMVLSNVYLRLGDAETARDYLRKAIASTREMGDVARLPLALDIGAAQALSEGRHADALRLLAAGAHRRAKMGGGTPNFVVDDHQMDAEARAALAEQGAADEADRAWDEGETLDDDALVALIG
jgi:tetratricopeptide (TPR) repeat protein